MKVGDYVTISGGSRAIILAVSKHKILLLRLGQSHNTFIVGHDPIVHLGELQWSMGLYFDCYQVDEGRMLEKAVMIYNNI